MIPFKFAWSFHGELNLPGWSPAMREAIFTGSNGAAGRWARVVQGWPLDKAGSGPQVDLKKALDSLSIDVRFEQFAEPSGQVVARTTIDKMTLPLKGVGRFPCAATIQIQRELVDEAISNLKLFKDIVSHELGHALGLGTIYDDRGLVTPAARYSGTNAVLGYYEILGCESATIPLSKETVQGRTAYHWSQKTLVHELMSEDVESTVGPKGNVLTNMLTLVSIGALADIGYLVDPSKAEQYPL